VVHTQVLSGESSYDGLDNESQAVIRTAWAEGIAEAISSLDLDEEFKIEGRIWVEGDEHSRAVFVR
jgi:hypothetical protein